MRVLPEPEDQLVSQAIRATCRGKGLMPDGSSPAFGAAKAYRLHYMGCSTFANYSVLPEIVLAKNSRRRAIRQEPVTSAAASRRALARVVNTAFVEPLARTVVVFWLWAGSA